MINSSVQNMMSEPGWVMIMAEFQVCVLGHFISPESREEVDLIISSGLMS